MPAGATKDQVAFYTTLMQKVRATPEWAELMRQGAFNTTSLAACRT